MQPDFNGLAPRASYSTDITLNDAGNFLVETRGFEPLTPCVQSRCSPAELRPHALTLYATEAAIRRILHTARSLSRNRVYSQTTAIWERSAAVAEEPVDLGGRLFL